MPDNENLPAYKGKYLKGNTNNTNRNNIQPAD